MDKDIERDDDMDISKEKNAPLEDKNLNHKTKVKSAIKGITAKHPKLLKKLAG